MNIENYKNHTRQQATTCDCKIVKFNVSFDIQFTRVAFQFGSVIEQSITE